MTNNRLNQLLKDSEARMNSILKKNSSFNALIMKYNKEFPEESLGEIVLRMNESEQKILFNIIMKNIFPLVQEFSADIGMK